MLTATYSLVAIAAEQEKARGLLSRVQKYIETTWKGLQNIDFAFLENAFHKLSNFDRFFRNRKLEMYLIPALRNTAQEVRSLIDQLDELSESASGILRQIGEQISGAIELSAIKVGQVCHAMTLYCNTLSTRLEREDKELLPMARRVLSIEEWFQIAAHFLSEDSEAYGRRRQSFLKSRPDGYFMQMTQSLERLR